MKLFELKPINGRKSFNGLCTVIENDNDYTLYSYNTPILKYMKTTKKLTRIWDGWSQTTQNHINSFLDFLGINEKGKAYYMTIPFDK